MFQLKIWHHGYFNEETDKHFITAQLFANPTISEDTEHFSSSFNVGQQKIITGQLGTTFGEYGIVKDLSDDLLQNWDTTYSSFDYPPPKIFGGMPIDCGKFHLRNWMKDPTPRPLLFFLKIYSCTFQLIGLRFYTKIENVMVFRNDTRTTNLVQGKLQRQL